MIWVGLAAGVLCVAVISWRLVGRSQAVYGPGSEVASYDEIKRRIRAGTGEGGMRVRTRRISEPKPLDQVFQLEGDEFLCALMDRVVRKAEQPGAPSLTSSEAALLYVMILEGEVNNGGFDQYFFNSSGDDAWQALSGLELIGARLTAEIVRQATDIFGEHGPSPSREARWGQMDLWSNEDGSTIERLDRKFYAYPDPIADLLEKHCREHRADFESEPK